ncbi:MAG: DUF4249 domain-containing protein [Prolixibacteraceae bacterium]
MKPKQPKMHLLPLLVFGSLLLSGCLKLVTDEFPKMEPIPTVNAYLRTGDTLKLHLSLAGTIDTSEIKNVNNADVQLLVNGNFIEKMAYLSEGNYTSHVLIESGKEYECIITIPGLDTVRCKQYIPKVSPIINIEHIDTSGFDEEGHPYAAFELTFSNDQDLDNYYELVLYKLSLDRETNAYTSYWSSWMIQVEDPVFLNEGIEKPVFSDELISDSTYTIHYNYYRHFNTWKCGDNGCTAYSQPEIVELRSVSEAYYLYKKQLDLYELGRYTGFEGTLATFPLYSNIENGYGIFAGYSFAQTDTIIASYVE